MLRLLLRGMSGHQSFDQIAIMGRKPASKAPKRVAPSKVAKKDARKAHFKKPAQESEEEEEPSEEEDEGYLAFNKSKGADSDDENYGNKREVFDLNMKDDDEVSAALLEASARE